MKTILFVLLVLQAGVYAESGDQPITPRIRSIPEAPKFFETFGPEMHATKGTLVFKKAEVPEVLQFGATHGLYGMGIVLHSEMLPTGLRQEFKKSHFVQILLGSYGTKWSAQIPQFSAITLVSRTLPTGRQSFVSVLPGQRTIASENLALMLFSSPSTPRERNDEEKLRGTYFAQAGLLTLHMLQTPQSVDVKTARGRFPFKMQSVKLEFNSLLATPFNTQDADLKGELEFPVYWPQGKASRAYVRQLVNDQLAKQFLPFTSEAKTAKQ